MTSTTGTTIETYLTWIKKELEKKEYGEVSIEFTVCAGQITKVRKGSFDNDKFELQKKGG
jgi:hypothetical protein